MNMIRNRLVPDPSMSDAEYLHQQARHPGRPNIGKVYVKENALTRLGGLAHIRQRQHHHEMAAERFKSLYEARYGVAAPGLDPSRVRVDASPRGHDSGMAARLDRTATLEQAMAQLGKAAADRLVALLVLGVAAGDLPRAGTGWRARKASVETVLEDLERLAVFWGFRMRG